MNSSYQRISNFGPNAQSPVTNPWSYCLNDNLDQRFLHGGNSDIYGQNSKPCQLFMADYCAAGWDNLCELASKNGNISYPNQFETCGAGDIACRGLTAGEALIHNTASRKYLYKMHGAHKKFEPFDPTVASSPMISYWVSDDCYSSTPGVPEYVVDPATIDDDVVMDKILAKPIIALGLLTNIYNTMKRYGTFEKLQGTKLGKFYGTHPYFTGK